MITKDMPLPRALTEIKSIVENTKMHGELHVAHRCKVTNQDEYVMTIKWKNFIMTIFSNVIDNKNSEFYMISKSHQEVFCDPNSRIKELQKVQDDLGEVIKLSSCIESMAIKPVRQAEFL